MTNRNISHIILAFLMLLLIAFAIYRLLVDIGNGYIKPGPLHQMDKAELEKRLAYHGCNVAFLGADGQWRFYRNGKECKLK